MVRRVTVLSLNQGLGRGGVKFGGRAGPGRDGWSVLVIQ